MKFSKNLVIRIGAVAAGAAVASALMYGCSNSQTQNSTGGVSGVSDAAADMASDAADSVSGDQAGTAADSTGTQEETAAGSDSATSHSGEGASGSGDTSDGQAGDGTESGAAAAGENGSSSGRNSAGSVVSGDVSSSNGSSDSSGSGSGSEEQTEETGQSDDDIYALTSVAEMEQVISSNPLRASRRYLDRHVAVSGRIVEIDADGVYIRIARAEETDAGGNADTTENDASAIGSNASIAENDTSVTGRNAAIAENDASVTGGNPAGNVTYANISPIPVTCMLKTEAQIDEAAGFAVGESITVCGTVSGVSQSDGYTIDVDRFDDVTVSYTESDYENYETMQVNGIVSFDIPLVWEADDMTIGLMFESEESTNEADSGISGGTGNTGRKDSGDHDGTNGNGWAQKETIRFSHETQDGNNDYLAQVTIFDVGEGVGDLQERENELIWNLGYNATVSSVTYDSVNDMQRAAIDTEFGSGTTQESGLVTAQHVQNGLTIQTVFFAKVEETDEDGTSSNEAASDTSSSDDMNAEASVSDARSSDEMSSYVYRFTLVDVSGDAETMRDNTAYFQNVTESARGIGTKFWSSRDYTGWHKVTLGDYSIMIKDKWNAYTREDFANVSDEELDEEIQYIVLLNEGGTLANTARMFVLDNSSGSGRNSGQLDMESLAGSDKERLISQITASMSSDDLEVTGVSFDHVNGAFRIKCMLGDDGQLKREDLVINGDTQYDFGYFTAAKDYSISIGQFTKCVRSFNMPDAAVMIERAVQEQ